ncbi:hypothetical protein D3C87_2079750 [compost metagenome]
MDEANVYPLQRQPLQRVFERAHGAVIAVVEGHFVRGRVAPGTEVDLRTRFGLEHASDLGGDHELIAIFPAQ